MDDFALEIIQPFNVWISRLIKLSDGRDQEVGFDRITRAELGIFTSGHVDIQFPA
jgi:hypothetical protein